MKNAIDVSSIRMKYVNSIGNLSMKQINRKFRGEEMQKSKQEIGMNILLGDQKHQKLDKMTKKTGKIIFDF